MEPFYFNTAERPLFGVFHPPRGDVTRSVGVVLCYPMGQEYIRSHRAFLQLAGRLAGAGFPCLRFDYDGCGDSGGDMTDAGPEQWMRNIGTAIDELRDGTGVASVCLMGLRLGATLAVLVGAERCDVEQMFLWEPVLHGQRYLNELKVRHREWLRGSFAKPQVGDGQNSTDEVLGFPLSARLAATITDLDLTCTEAIPATKMLLLENTEEGRLHPLWEHYRGLGIQAEHRLVPAPPAWLKIEADAENELGGCLVPSDVLDAAVAWLSEVNK